MTNEEAIMFCKGYLPECDIKKYVLNTLVWTEKLDLNKQIPKRALNGDDKTYLCPECKTLVGTEYYKHKYCPYCGQRLEE